MSPQQKAQPCSIGEVELTDNKQSMKKNFLAIISCIALSSFVLSSCDTPVGQGAAWGAATGAIIGGAATGNVRAASIGAAAGAAAGALTGKIIQENQAAQYGPPPPGGFPVARWAGTPGFYYSPYTGRVYDLRGVPPGGLTRDVDTGRLFRRP
jgi:predicted small secreted protein